MSVLSDLPKPFFVLAPMDDVTDTVFRQVIADCVPPDLYFTEFSNVDGLQSPGRPRLLKKLQHTNKDQPLIAHIWGKNPENFYKTARQIVDGTLADEIKWREVKNGDAVQGGSEQHKGAYLDVRGLSSGADNAAMRSNFGFAGIDLNMGCPVKDVVAHGVCSALMKDRPLADEIIHAVQEGAQGKLPISVKTRLGFNDIDYTWHEFLLNHNLDMLTVHARTRKEMSKVPAHWQDLGAIKELRDKISPDTLLVGNGDVMNREQGQQLAEAYGLDGVMIGRGVFHDPFAFAAPSPWETYDRSQRIALYKKHVELFMTTWQNGERAIHTLNKFCKIYINGFDGAKELREELMAADSAEDLLEQLERA